MNLLTYKLKLKFIQNLNGIYFIVNIPTKQKQQYTPKNFIFSGLSITYKIWQLLKGQFSEADKEAKKY